MSETISIFDLLPEDDEMAKKFKPISYAHFKGTEECPIKKESEDTE